MRVFIGSAACSLAMGILARLLWENLPFWGVTTIAVSAFIVAWFAFSRMQNRPQNPVGVKVKRRIISGGKGETGAVTTRGADNVQVDDNIIARQEGKSGDITQE